MSGVSGTIVPYTPPVCSVACHDAKGEVPNVIARPVVFLSALAALSLAAFGQTATGTIQGKVFDPTGAAVPAAAVTIENQNLGTKQATTTNAQGEFFVPYLIPGTYRATVEQRGFDKHVTSDLQLSVQQTIALELRLRVGEVSTTVEVSADVAQLNTSTSAVSTVITNKAMLDLPLNGRNPFGLASLVPGV